MGIGKKPIRLMLIIIALFVSSNLVWGCTTCIPSENKNISAVAEVFRKPEYYGLGVHYNITVNIKNNGDILARYLHMETFYCNNLIVGHECHNQTFFIGDLYPNEKVQRHFEYDIDAIRETAPEKYNLQYRAMSC